MPLSFSDRISSVRRREQENKKTNNPAAERSAEKWGQKPQQKQKAEYGKDEKPR